MIEIKDGVQPPALIILACIANVAEQRQITLRITSGLDGKHSDFSGHYQLRCLDVGSKELPLSQKESIRADIESEIWKYFLPSRVYVQIHNVGEDNEHIHAQFK